MNRPIMETDRANIENGQLISTRDAYLYSGLTRHSFDKYIRTKIHSRKLAGKNYYLSFEITEAINKLIRESIDGIES